ncbi:MAG: RNA polymerase sporulation sigma factor SigK [Acutalibacteraceae bacterium]
MFSALVQMLSHVAYMALQVVSFSSFPRPLSAQRERECLVAWREGGDMAARGELIEHNLRLVAHIVKKYYSRTADQDDLISIGTIGLIKAVNTFDYHKGTRLVTYASRCVENEIRMYFRAGRKTAQDVSLSDPIDTDRDGQQLTLIDVLAADDTIADDLEIKINAEKLRRYVAETLDEREAQVIGWRYGLDGAPHTQREVAKTLGISRSYVSRIEKRALQKLRERYEKGDRR